MFASAGGVWLSQKVLKQKESTISVSVSGAGQIQGPKPATPASSVEHESSDVEAALKKIKGLLEQGLIDQDDYDRKKQQILDDM